MKKILVIVIVFALSGCCMYHGKPVSKKRADQMRAMGMDVVCPNED